MANEHKNNGVTVEDFYAERGLAGKGFLQRMTFPPGACSVETTYTHPYIIYPLTEGTLSIEISGKPADPATLQIGVVYVRHASPENPVTIKVCNEGDYPIIILKG